VPQAVRTRARALVTQGRRGGQIHADLHSEWAAAGIPLPVNVVTKNKIMQIATYWRRKMKPVQVQDDRVVLRAGLLAAAVNPSNPV
jgi:hypothetical protein